MWATSGRPRARRIFALRGKPDNIVSDNRTELTANAILAWPGDCRVSWHDIASGKAQQNGWVESVSGPGAAS